MQRNGQTFSNLDLIKNQGSFYYLMKLEISQVQFPVISQEQKGPKGSLVPLHLFWVCKTQQQKILLFFSGAFQFNPDPHLFFHFLTLEGAATCPPLSMVLMPYAATTALPFPHKMTIVKKVLTYCVAFFTRAGGAVLNFLLVCQTPT